MKKLLLLLLLSLSFSTFALSLIPLEPCVGGVIQKTFEEEKLTLLNHLESLSEDERVEQIEEIDKIILEIDTYLSVFPKNGEKCKQSPEGALINDVREGKWTWYDQFNRVIQQGNYVNGKKEGSWTEWIFTGYAFDTIQMNYKNDKLEGKWTRWDSYEGPSTTDYNAATIGGLEMLLELYIADENQTKIDEIKTQIKEYEVPSIIEQGNYINGKKEGTWTYWFSYSPRRIKKVEIYEDGVLKLQ